jgi:pimeloyl-ACP methyl ester carboxylesterase
VSVPSTDGVELAIHDLGGHGPVLLVAHATGFHGIAYQPLATELASRFHTVAFDFRAHGDSPRPARRELDWLGMSEDVLAVVDTLDDGPLYAFGHSMGGCALVLAELTRPGTFQSMYLFEPVLIPTRVYPTTLDSNPMAAAASRRHPVFGSRVAAYENYASKPPLNELREDALRAYVEHGFRERDDGTVELKCSPADEAETFMFGASTGAFERLGDVRCPVTIARGVAESFGPAAFCEAQVEALPAGRFVGFDDLGHFGPLQDPPRIASSIVESLSGS